MEKPFELRLRLANVVVRAERHVPRILSPEFLSALAVVPPDWHVVEYLNRAQLSTVRYHNGVYWSLDRDTLLIEDDRRRDLVGPCEVHALACKYLEEVRGVKYQDLGLNFYLSVDIDNPDGWLREHFMGLGVGVEELHGLLAEPHFSFVVESAKVTITLSGGAGVLPESGAMAGVLVGINVYWAELSSSSEMVSAIKSWDAIKTSVKDVVTALVGEVS